MPFLHRCRKGIETLKNDTFELTGNVDVPRDREWEMETVQLIGDTIVSMFDQLCYLVVFGNRLDME